MSDIMDAIYVTTAEYETLRKLAAIGARAKRRANWRRRITLTLASIAGAFVGLAILGACVGPQTSAPARHAPAAVRVAHLAPGTLGADFVPVHVIGGGISRCLIARGDTSLLMCGQANLTS